eukprot:9135027-Prorocentrum_lima.AAC.1
MAGALLLPWWSVEGYALGAANSFPPSMRFRSTSTKDDLLAADVDSRQQHRDRHLVGRSSSFQLRPACETG